MRGAPRLMRSPPRLMCSALRPIIVAPRSMPSATGPALDRSASNGAERPDDTLGRHSAPDGGTPIEALVDQGLDALAQHLGGTRDQQILVVDRAGSVSRG
jgi:hypothetical protein